VALDEGIEASQLASQFVICVPFRASILAYSVR